MIPEHVSLGILEAIVDGSYESAECELIGRYLPNDKPVIELGGCLGLVSCFVANMLRSDIQHIVVEANPTLIEACRHNATLGGTRSATDVLQNAVAYDETQVAFKVGNNVHVGKLSKSGDTGTILVEPIRLEKLVDQIAPTGAYSRICDIEGAELDLFEHEAEALKRCGTMVVELHPEVCEVRGQTMEDAIEMVRDTGLKLIAQDHNVYAFAR